MFPSLLKGSSKNPLSDLIPEEVLNIGTRLSLTAILAISKVLGILTIFADLRFLEPQAT